MMELVHGAFKVENNYSNDNDLFGIYFGQKLQVFEKLIWFA